MYAKDGKLFLNGQRYRFIGVNMYSIVAVPADVPGYHCGNGFTDAQARTALAEVAAMGGRVVRVPVYQSVTRSGADYSRFDLLVDEAERLGLTLVPILESQWYYCTSGGYKYATWYASGYKKPYGAYRKSLRQYADETARRYRGRKGILAWQVMNESETRTTTDLADPESLLDFARDMLRIVQRADPTHLAMLGTEGVLKPSSGGPVFALIAGLPDNDVVEVHDYGQPKVGMPIAVHLARLVAKELRRPFIIGEVGVSSPRFTKKERAHMLMHKLQAAWAEDVDGVLLWSYRSVDGTSKHFGPKDPIVKEFRLFSIREGIQPKPPGTP